MSKQRRLRAGLLGLLRATILFFLVVFEN